MDICNKCREESDEGYTCDGFPVRSICLTCFWDFIPEKGCFEGNNISAVRQCVSCKKTKKVVEVYLCLNCFCPDDDDDGDNPDH